MIRDERPLLHGWTGGQAGQMHIGPSVLKALFFLGASGHAPLTETRPEDFQFLRLGW